MVPAVPSYRVFALDEERHALGPPAVVECGDDEAALEYARQLADGTAVEIWERGRFIALVSGTGRITPG